MAQSVKLKPLESIADKAGPTKAGPPGPSKLLNWNFILLWQGQVVSGLGAQFYSIAMVLWIKQATDSASLLGLINTLTGLTAVLLGVFAGTLADRYERRKIIIVSDLVRGVLMLVLAGLLFVTPQSTGMIVVWMAATAICMSIASSFFRPAIAASLPELVPDDQLTRANSLTSSSSQVTRFLGLALGGLLFRVLGAPLITLVNGVTYIFSAVSEMFITIPQNIPEKGSDWREEARVFKSDLAEGFHYVWNNRGLRALVLAAAFFGFFTSPVLLLIPFYIEDFLGVVIDWYGYFLSAFGIGVLAGSIAAGAITLNGQLRATVLIALIFINSVIIAAFGVTHNIYVAMVLAVLVGSSIGFNSVHMSAILQKSIPSEIRGRAFGFMGTISGSTGPLGMAVGGLVFDFTGQNIPLIYIGCGAVQFLAAIALAMSQNYRNFVAFEPAESNSQEQNG